MALKLGDVVTDTCQPIKKGVLFRLFQIKCPDTTIIPPETPKLAKIPPTPNPTDIHTPYRHKLPHNARKDDYINYELEHHLQVCEKSEFAKKWKLLKTKVKLPGKCPFFNCTGIYYHAFVNYSEATGPANHVNSAELEESHILEKGLGFDEETYETSTIGDPFGFGSLGTGTCTLKLSIVDAYPDDPCTPVGLKMEAHLDSFGLPYDYLAGTPLDQETFIGCDDFLDGRGLLSVFWTGVTFPAGPIGLVMNISAGIRGGYGSLGCT